MTTPPSRTISTTPGLAASETAPERPSPRFYRPELDALRFGAFLLVFAYHALPASLAACRSRFCDAHGAALAPFFAVVKACGVGLPLFFILSAFLIASLMMRERDSTGRIHVLAFYARRVLRIWPLYYVALAIALAIALGERQPSEVAMVASFAAFAGNWFLTTSPQWRQAMDNPFGILWSTSIIEQFYLVFPLALSLVPRMRVATLGALTTAVSLAALYLQGRRHLQIDSAIWFNGFSQALFFGAGLLLAATLRDRAPRLGNRARAAIVVASALLAVLATSAFDIRRDAAATSGSTVVAGYALTAVACAGFVLGVYGATWRVPSPLIYLGKISFGLYVFHLASAALFVRLFAAAHLHVGDFAAHLISLVGTIAVAVLSYEYFEKPFLRIKGRLAFVKTSPSEAAAPSTPTAPPRPIATIRAEDASPDAPIGAARPEAVEPEPTINRR